MSLFFDLIGWAGAAMLLAAYYLSNIRHSQTPLPRWFNVFGSLFLLASALYTQTYPFVVLNFAWMVIAIRVIILGERVDLPGSGLNG